MYCIRRNLFHFFLNIKARPYSDKVTGQSISQIPPEKKSNPEKKKEFVPVFKFPFITRLAMLNRVKLYQIISSTVAIPGCGLLEFLEFLPTHSTALTAYFGISTTALLCLVSLPIVNTIGLLYVSTDKKKIKISYLDFWGRRNDKIINTDDWIPLMDSPSKKTDFLYLTPHLADGTKYKLFIKYGEILNKKIIGEVLE